MGKIIAVVSVLIQFVSAICKWKTETDSEKRAEKLECVRTVYDGIAKRDPAAVTAGFDRLRRT